MSASHFEDVRGLDALRGVVAKNLAQPGLVRAREVIAGALAQGQVSGEVGADVDMQMAASLLIAMMDGLQIQWLLIEEFDMLAAFDAFLTTFRVRISAG